MYRIQFDIYQQIDITINIYTQSNQLLLLLLLFYYRITLADDVQL